MNDQPINVLLADDHRIVVDGLRSLLASEPGFEVVATASNGQEAITKLAQYDIDVAVLDFEMPGMDGLEVTHKIHQEYPHIKVVLLTMHSQPAKVKQAVEADADAYILKERGSAELCEAIRTVMDGGKFFSPKVQDAILRLAKGGQESESQGGVKLTKREKEVLALLIEGLTTNQIANRLFVAPSTVETHRRNLLDKTGSSNSRALIVLALNEGWISNQ